MGAEGVDHLIDVLKSSTYKPQRQAEGPFIFSVDHCFSIRGQGTVMTGTVLSGSLNVNDVSSFWGFLSALFLLLVGKALL